MRALKKKKKSSKAAGVVDPMRWHQMIAIGAQTGHWEEVRRELARLGEERSKAGVSSKKKVSFWKGGKHEDGTFILLSQQDLEGRTPLHLALLSRETPIDVILNLLRLEPKAASMVSQRGRFPLHFAVIHKHGFEVVAELVEIFPAAMSEADAKGYTPLAYAVDIAVKQRGKKIPSSYWMPAEEESPLAEWQDRQAEVWRVTHWLLLSSASHPQTCLTVGGKKPMLVDALICAAPPPVISLLIGASSSLLTYENRASAFAASTIYSCITRHYPLNVLMNLVSQCPSDLRHIRDETGMGLVSAQFISGCFEQLPGIEEMAVREDFYVGMTDCLTNGTLDSSKVAFCEWWKKIQYLLVYCCGEDPGLYLRERLLHAALMNPDTPPPVVEMIISLYPRSVKLADPVSDMYPIHMAALADEYIPRNYENQLVSDGVLDMVVDTDPSSIYQRFDDRLALHMALEVGKTMDSIACLYQSNTSVLKRLDPYTGLYPVLLAASYPNRSEKDSSRWTIRARNKYSNAVWTGLSDRQRAAAVLRVIEEEDMERLSTIYDLLRCEPSVVKPAQKSRTAREGRDAAGMGPVAKHYMSWCYEEVRQGKFVANVQNLETLRDLTRAVGEDDTSSRDIMSYDMNKWLQRMKILIKKHAVSSMVSIPSDDSYLLHAAISNPDTPPQIVHLFVAMHPLAITRKIPGTSILPIHLAAVTQAYTPRPFESVRQSSLDIIIKARPNTLRANLDGSLPLHLAIKSGKTWSEIEVMVRNDKTTLIRRDRSTGLYPFQLMAVKRQYTPAQRVNFQYMARNRHNSAQWSRMSEAEQAKEYVQVEKEYQLEILSGILCLLRENASMLQRKSRHAKRQKSLEEEIAAMIQDDCKFDGSDAADNDSSDDSAKKAAIDSANSPRTKPGSLFRLLSKGGPKDFGGDKDVFDCDASLVSGLDMMSTLSGSLHNRRPPKKERPSKRPPSKHGSNHMTPSNMPYHSRKPDQSEEDDSESSYEFAEDVLPDSIHNGSAASSAASSEGSKSGGLSGSSQLGNSMNSSKLSETSFGMSFGGLSTYSAATEHTDLSKLVNDAESTSTDASSEIEFRIHRRNREERKQRKQDPQSMRRYSSSSEPQSSPEGKKPKGRKLGELMNKSKLNATSSDGLDGSVHTEGNVSYMSLKPDDLKRNTTSQLWLDKSNLSQDLKESIRSLDSTGGQGLLGPHIDTTEEDMSTDDQIFSHAIAGKPTKHSLLQDNDSSAGSSGREDSEYESVEDEEGRHSSQEDQGEDESDENLIEVVIFDKVAFKWVKVRKAPIPRQNVVTEVPPSDSSKDIIFDRATMRWRTRGEIDKDSKERVNSNGQAETGRKDKNNDTVSSSAAKNPWLANSKASSRNVRCVVCEKNSRGVLVLPCRHLCLCEACSISRLDLTDCPLCGQEIKGQIKIF